MAEKKPNTTKKAASPKKEAAKKPAAAKKTASKKTPAKKQEQTPAQDLEKENSATLDSTAQQEAEVEAAAPEKEAEVKTEAKDTQPKAKKAPAKKQADATGATPAGTAPEKPKRKQTKGELAMFIVSIVLLCLMAPILITNIVLIIGSAVHPDRLPSIFGIKPVVVISDSMYPEIKVNDLIFVKEADYSNLEVGTTITFHEKDGGAVVTHKIMDKSTNSHGEVCYQTYGIYNYAKNEDGTPKLPIQSDGSYGNIVYDPDQYNTEAGKEEWVTADQIEGVYQARIGGLGGFILWMQGTVGIIVCIGIPLTAFVIYELIRRNNELKAAKASNKDSEAELEELRKKLAELEKNGK